MPCVAAKSLAIQLVCANKTVYKELPYGLRDDQDVFESALKYPWGTATPLSYATPRLRDIERNVYLSVKRSGGSSFKHASKRLRQDYKVCLRVCQIDFSCYNHVLMSVKKRPEFRLAMVKMGVLDLATNDMLKDRDLVLESLRNNRYAFSTIEGTDYRYDKEMYLASRSNFAKAPPYYKDDRAFALAYFTNAYRMSEFTHVSNRLKEDVAFIIELLEKTKTAVYTLWGLLPKNITDNKIVRGLFLKKLRCGHEIRSTVGLRDRDALVAFAKLGAFDSYCLQQYPELDTPEFIEMDHRGKMASRIIKWWKRDIPARSFKLAVYAVMRLEKEKRELAAMMNPKRLLDCVDDDDTFWETQEQMENGTQPLTSYVENLRKTKRIKVN